MPLEVKKQDRENSQSLVRRFSRRVQQSGILRQARKTRFKERGLSKAKSKKRALRRIKARQEREKSNKLGKITEQRYGSR